MTDHDDLPDIDPDMDPEIGSTVRLAREVFKAALADDWTAVAHWIGQLNTDRGGDGLFLALTIWCDTLIHHATGGRWEPADKIRVVPMNSQTGALGDHIDMPDRARWAQRLVQARASMNREAFTACVAELNAIDDGYVRGAHVGALLECLALTIRDLPSGFGGGHGNPQLN